MDCAFDESVFFAITAGLWLLTSLLFFAKAVLPRGTAATGAARWCLLSMAMSSLCMSADALVYLLTRPHGGNFVTHGGNFVNQVFTALGTIFMGFGMRWFAWLWCKIVGALDSQASVRGHNHFLCTRLVRIVWWSYTILAFLNVPVALVLAVCGTSAGPSYHDGVTVWFSWVLFSACFAFSLTAVLMWIVAVKYLPEDANVGSLVIVTKINLVEQLIYNLTLVFAGGLYMSPAYNKYGMVQAAVFALLFVAAWLMHIQMLIFFAVTQPDDPMYSQKQLKSLLLLISGELEVVAEATAGAVAVARGSPKAKKTTTPTPSKIGSPVPESAQQRPNSELQVDFAKMCGDLEQC